MTARSETKQDARRLAAKLLEKHGEVQGRQAFLRVMGAPPFATALGSADAAQIFEGVVPKPTKPAPRPWVPPAVRYPTGRDREQLVRSLVDYGIRPASLADAVVRLIQEASWDKDRAISWGRTKMKASNRWAEPWIRECEEIVART